MAVFKEIIKADGSGVTTFYRISDTHDTVETDDSEGEAVVFDYNQAQNKPSINGVTLVGDKTSEDLGLQPAGDYITNDEADAKFIGEDELEAKDYVNETQLQEALANIEHFHREIVAALPVQGDPNVLYLVRKQGSGEDIYNEYIWVGLTASEDGYEFLGTTSTDLTDYYQKSEVNALLANKVDKVSGKGLSDQNYTLAEKTKLAGLENYDDTQLRAAVAALHNYDDTELRGDISDLEDDITTLTTGLNNVVTSDGKKIEAIRLVKSGDNWSWQTITGDVITFSVAQQELGHEDTILIIEDIENDGKYSPLFYRSYGTYLLICYENENKDIILVNAGATNTSSNLGKNARYKGITTSQPATGNVGDIIIDRDSELVYIYNGSDWIPFDKGGEIDLSNYLAKDNTVAWIPTGAFNPATKKYVDDTVGAVFVPTKTSQLQNDSNFIGVNSNNLTYYYTKTQTYTKAEVDALIAGGGGGGSNISITVNGDTLVINTQSNAQASGII